jgi:transcription elongation factor GreA
MIRALWEKLDRELQDLQRELRQELPREIGRALSMGDLRENAEYQMALERQSYVQARIAQLKGRLAELSTLNLNDIPKDRVAIGSTVTLLDQHTGSEVVYELVMNDQADVSKGHISIGSPIARGLIGKRVGDEVELAIPAGRKRYEILGVQPIHEKVAAAAKPPPEGAA